MKYIFYFIGILFLLPVSLQTMQKQIYTLVDSTLNQNATVLENTTKKPVIRILANALEKRIIQLILHTKNAQYFYDVIKKTPQMQSNFQLVPGGVIFRYATKIEIEAPFDKNKDKGLIYDICQSITNPNSGLALLLDKKSQRIQMFINVELYEHRHGVYPNTLTIPQ